MKLKSRTKKTILVFLTGLFHVFISTGSYAEELYLNVGQTHRIAHDQSETIKIKGPKIFQIDIYEKFIQITAQQPGYAKIFAGDKKIDLYIVHKNQSGFLQALQALLKNYMGLTAQLEGGSVVIRGKLYRLTDWQQIYDIAKNLGATYKLEAQIDKDVTGEAELWMNTILSQEGLMSPAFEFSNGVVAYLPEDQKKLSTHWEKILGRLGISIQYEKSQVAVEQLVRVNIVVAEVNKKLQSQMGVEWPDMISAQLAPKLSGPTSLNVFLKAMEQNGLGQILASPNLLAKSGAEAEFLAGGEFAIKIITARTRDVIWKRHGIFLKIKPTADRLGRLSIELSTEVSLVDTAQSIEGIPALKTNRMSTHFDLMQARTIVLSGLIRSDWGRSTEGIIGFAKIPIIGGLFRSEDFHNNRSELVIFVTPEIVKNSETSAPNKIMPKSWNQQYE